MRTKGTRTVKLADLQTNMFVRKELNQDHVLYLADLIENGVQLRDLIEVTDRDDVMNVIVEGRHRKDAYELCSVAEVKVKVLEFNDEAEMVAYAYKANTGGSLPPTPQDTEHTIMLLLDRKETMKRIGELLGLPAGMARKYINSVKSKMDRAKLLRAKSAVLEGSTITKAAEDNDVSFEKLREALAGKKGGRGKKSTADVQRTLTKTYKSVSQKNAAALRKVIDEYGDGDMPAKQVLEIFEHLEKLQKQSARSVADWKKRFEAMGKEAKKSA